MNERLTEFWEKGANAGVKLLAFVLPLAFYLKTYNTDLVKEATLLAGVCVIWFCTVARHIEAGRVEWPANRTLIAVLAKALCGWLLVVWALSAQPELYAFPLMRFLLFVTLFLLVATGPASVSFAAGLSAAASAAAGLAGLYAVLQAAGLDPLLWQGAYGRQAFATMARPELLGVFSAAAFPLALSLTVNPTAQRAKRLAAHAAAAAAFTGVILSGSGTALAVFAVAAALFSLFALARLGGEGRAAGWLAAAAVPAAALGTIAYGGGFAALLSLRLRPSLLPASGTGPALLCAVLLLAVFASSLKDYLRRSREGELRAAAIIAGQWAGAFAILLAGLLGAAANSAAIGALLWLLAGSLTGLALERGAAQVYVIPIPAPPGLRRLLYLPAGALAALGCLAALTLMGWDCNHNTALHLAGRGETAAAVARFDGVSLWHPNGLHARYLAANLTAGAGDWENALRRYDQLERRARHYRRLDFRKAAALAALHRGAEAERSLLAYVKFRTDDPEAYRLLVDVSTDLGKNEQSHRAALQLVRLEPDEPRHWHLLAEQYKRRGDYANARRMLDRASKVRDYAGGKTSPGKPIY
ncbi:MAG: hypothetical protein ABIJ96_05890 [Elusimicrobiota bacterium]